MTPAETQRVINNYAKLKQKVIEAAEELEAGEMSHTDTASWLLELAEDIKTWDED